MKTCARLLLLGFSVCLAAFVWASSLRADSVEPLGPSSRKTGLVISEIMYRPIDRLDRRNLEFIEIYNSNPYPENMSGFRLTADVSYTFPSGSIIAPGSFLLVVGNAPDFQSVYNSTNVIGEFFNQFLPNGSGTIRLRDLAGTILLEVEYRDTYPWPRAADGAGPSLVLARPSLGENNPLAWGASRFVGGSPGRHETITNSPLDGVIINEVLANPRSPNIDFVEFYNGSTQAVNIAGCILSDDPISKRYVFPQGSVIAARGFLALDEFILGFGFNSDGETLYFRTPDSGRVVDILSFGPQEVDRAFGRYASSTAAPQPLAVPTPFAPNSRPLVSDLVINEIMYAPPSGNPDEAYVELYNRGSNWVDVTGWQFVEGITLTLPQVLVPPGGFLVVAKNALHLQSVYPQLSPGNLVGDYEGVISELTERIALHKAELIILTNIDDVVSTNLIFSLADEVTYNLGGHWQPAAHGLGSSLELIDAHSDNQLADNWAASSEGSKSSWSTVEVTARVDHADSIYGDHRHVQFVLPRGGEVLIDNVEVFTAAGANRLANGQFEVGLQDWFPRGSHQRSIVHSESGSMVLHLKADEAGDTAINNVQSAPLTPPLSTGETVTFRFQAKWISGWPQVLLRLRGNGLDVLGDLPLPVQSGSPGLPNTRASSNAPPVIHAVQHQPVLPATGQDVVLTARVDDPQGLSSLVLSYRLDPATNNIVIPLRDDGSNGDVVAADGVHSARLPGQVTGAMIAFSIAATDNLGATSRFPASRDFTPGEGLVRWGEAVAAGDLGQYHLWFSANALTRWTERHPLQSSWVHGTFVYGSNRVVHGVGARFGGTPWDMDNWQGPVGSNRCDYAVQFPETEPFLGAHRGSWLTPGRAVGAVATDRGAISQELASWAEQQLLLPYARARPVHVFVNGSPRSVNATSSGNFVMHDLERPIFDRGLSDFRRIEGWYEFDEGVTNFHFNSAELTRRATIIDGLPGRKPAAYRWSWRSLNLFPSQTSAVDQAFDNLLDVFSPPANPDSARITNLDELEATVNISQWMDALALHHFLGNWSTYGFRQGLNAAVHVGEDSRFVLTGGEIEAGFGLGGGTSPVNSLTETHDSRLQAVFNTPALARRYWRSVQRISTGLMDPVAFFPLMDQRAGALISNNVSIHPSVLPIMKNYIADRRSYVGSQLNTMSAPFVLNTYSITTSNNIITLSGTAPLFISDVQAAGFTARAEWINMTNWVLRLVIPPVSTQYVLYAYDANGTPTTSAQVQVNFTGLVEYPAEIVGITEIFLSPGAPEQSFVELHNRAVNTTVDLGKWFLRGVNFTFPPNTWLTNGQTLMVTRDRAAFAAAFGHHWHTVGNFPDLLDQNQQLLHLVGLNSGPAPPALGPFVADQLKYATTPPWPTPSPGESLQIFDARADSARVSSWIKAPPSPGVVARLPTAPPPYPKLWINEVCPEHATDSFGFRTAWLELFNSDPNSLQVVNLFLTTNLAAPFQWQIPPRTMASQERRLVWCDAESSPPAAMEWHANFLLQPTNGLVALFQSINGTPRLLDYVLYTNAVRERCIASHPEGQSIFRSPDHPPSPGDRNPPMTILVNEWLASNDSILRDEADDDFEDWMEIYNPLSVPVDLTTYRFSDDSGRGTYAVGRVLEPKSFLLAWCDRELEQNLPGARDLHVDFRLSTSSEVIRIQDPFGTFIDNVSFSSQIDNQSSGRTPDGHSRIDRLMRPTPRSANAMGLSNSPPYLVGPTSFRIGLQEPWQYRLAIVDSEAPPQTVVATLLAPIPEGALLNTNGILRWDYYSDTWPSRLVGTNLFQVRLADNHPNPGISTNIIRVIVFPPPSIAPPRLLADGSLMFSWVAEVGRTYRVEASTTLRADEWYPVHTQLLATQPFLSFTNPLTPINHQFFRVILTP